MILNDQHFWRNDSPKFDSNMSLWVRKREGSREKVLGKLKYMGSTKTPAIGKNRGLKMWCRIPCNLLHMFPSHFGTSEFVAGESICLYARNFNEKPGTLISYCLLQLEFSGNSRLKPGFHLVGNHFRPTPGKSRSVDHTWKKAFII